MGGGAAIAAEAAGSIASSALGFLSAERQMKFQERLSSTAHQREVGDLRAAGLNPILSATGGHGASTPSGVSVTPENPLKGMAQTVLASKMNAQQIASMQIDNKLKERMILTESQKILNMQQDAKVASALELKTIAESKLPPQLIKKYVQDVLESMARTRLTSAQGVSEKLKQSELTSRSDFWKSPEGKARPYVEGGLQDVLLRAAGGGIKHFKDNYQDRLKHEVHSAKDAISKKSPEWFKKHFKW
jgi:hypothetical protein